MAIRGLTYDSGFVEPATDSEDVLQEKWLGEDVDTLLQRGAGYQQQNAVIESIEAYTLAVLVGQGVPEAYHGLGQALRRGGEMDKAVAALQTALQLDPSLTPARYQLASAYSMQGRFQDAINAYREVLTLDPNHAKAHKRLAITLYYMNGHEESWEHVHAAEALGRQVPPQFRLLLEG